MTGHGNGILQDPEALRQKGSRLAQLAVRRHQRQIKAPDRAERLARSNAVVMRRAAQSLIRGQGPQPDGGWADAPQEAAILCFDEVQITDPFTAVALKGWSLLSYCNQSYAQPTYVCRQGR